LFNATHVRCNMRLAFVTFCTSGGGNDSDGGDEMRDSEQRQPDEDDTSMQEVSC